MANVCRLVPFREADGPTNMAIDEALLASVAASGSGPVVRTYGWTVPTLSLGYFQTSADAAAQPGLREAPLVRRPTGGGAIWHEHELTYALVVPRGHRLAREARELYQAVHAQIAALLCDRGIAAQRRGGTPVIPAHEGARPFFCFTDLDAEDIVVRGVKVVGSAQRRRSGVVLQHGSVLLSRSQRTPGLPGLAELAAVPVNPRPGAWSTAVGSALALALAPDVQAEDLSGTELAQAERLAREVYANPAWTHRR